MMLFVLGMIFGTGLCNFANSDSENTSIVTFLHNDSFSAIMPLNPGEDVVINLQNNSSVAFVDGNCWVFYSATEDGLVYHNYSKECYE